MTIGYRSILRLDDETDAIQTSTVEFSRWLDEMVHDSRKTVETSQWNGPGIHQLGPDSTLTVTDQIADGNIHRLLLEYVESNAAGRFTTRVYAATQPASERYKQAMWIESEGERSDGIAVRPGTPRIVRNILNTVKAYDGKLPILPEPTLVGATDAEELFSYIMQPRRISIVVASPVPDVPSTRWTQAIATLVRDSIGCASFFVLDQQALDILNSRLGRTHSILPGAVRTFLPQVELCDWADAKRHRILTARTMVQELGNNLRFSDRLVRTISAIPRQNLLKAKLPAELIQTARILQREQIAQEGAGGTRALDIMRQAETSAMSPPIPTQDWITSVQSLVSRFLGPTPVNSSAIEAVGEKYEQLAAAVRLAAISAKERQLERERLEDQLNDLSERLEAEQYERALAEMARREAEKKMKSLEHWRAQREDKYKYIEQPVPSWESDPVSVSEIVERLTDQGNYAHILQYVELTDINKAIDRAAELDEIDNFGTYATAFWEYILVLRDYMAEYVERGFKGNLHQYLTSEAVSGRKCPVQRHKSNESDTVQNNAKMREERTFPVPSGVDEAREVFMSTHFAPTHRDQNAPRMYYLADVTRTKKAYIGYIGVHLTNTKTT